MAQTEILQEKYYDFQNTYNAKATAFQSHTLQKRYRKDSMMISYVNTKENKDM